MVVTIEFSLNFWLLRYCSSPILSRLRSGVRKYVW